MCRGIFPPVLLPMQLFLALEPFGDARRPPPFFQTPLHHGFILLHCGARVRTEIMMTTTRVFAADTHLFLPLGRSALSAYGSVVSVSYACFPQYITYCCRCTFSLPWGGVALCAVLLYPPSLPSLLPMHLPAFMLHGVVRNTPSFPLFCPFPLPWLLPMHLLAFMLHGVVRNTPCFLCVPCTVREAATSR